MVQPDEGVAGLFRDRVAEQVVGQGDDRRWARNSRRVMRADEVVVEHAVSDGHARGSCKATTPFAHPVDHHAILHQQTPVVPLPRTKLPT